MTDLVDQSLNTAGIEVSATGLHAAVIGHKGDLVSTRSMPIVGTEGIVDEIVEFARELGKEYTFGRVGLAVPGLVDRSSRRVAFSTPATCA